MNIMEAEVLRTLTSTKVDNNTITNSILKVREVKDIRIKIMIVTRMKIK